MKPDMSPSAAKFMSMNLQIPFKGIWRRAVRQVVRGVGGVGVAVISAVVLSVPSPARADFSEQQRIVTLFECSVLSAEFERDRWQSFLQSGEAAGLTYFENYKPTPGFRVIKGYPPAITKAERLPGGPGFRTGYVFGLVLDGMTGQIDRAAGVDRENPCASRDDCKALRERRRTTARALYDERNCAEMLR